MFTMSLAELGTCALLGYVSERIFLTIFVWYSDMKALLLEHLPWRRADLTFEQASGTDNLSCLTADSEGAAKNPELALLW